MNNIKYIIDHANPADAPDIATAIMMAVGDEIVNDFAGSADRVPLVRRTFERLAARQDSQYSYLNTLVARASDGSVAGVIISYDGANLHSLREAFFEVASEELNAKFDERMPDETDASEIYLDTIAVFEPHRGQGIATKLIDAACRHHSKSGKLIGLLVEPENERAYRLYRSLGFEFVGKRPFADFMMDHLQRN